MNGRNLSLALPVGHRVYLFYDGGRSRHGIFLLQGSFRRPAAAVLGFAAGIMVAASVWSLLIPAIDMAEEQGMIGWLPPREGFF